MKFTYRSIFISDVHLGSSGCQVEKLNSWLKQHDAQYIYLIGDIIDLWMLRTRVVWPKSHNEFLQILLKKSKKGTQIYYIPGNHDEYIREFEGNRFDNIQISLQHIHTTADGRKLLVTHGDQFDSIVKIHPWLARLGSIGYDILMRLNQSIRRVQRIFNLREWSFSGYIKRQVKDAVKYVSAFESVLAKYAHDNGYNGVVCGHIHWPAIDHIDGVAYYNCGDWVENCSLLTESLDGNIQILRYDTYILQNKQEE